jgi:hypothetical protein
VTAKIFHMGLGNADYFVAAETGTEAREKIADFLNTNFEIDELTRDYYEANYGNEEEYNEFIRELIKDGKVIEEH